MGGRSRYAVPMLRRLRVTAILQLLAAVATFVLLALGTAAQSGAATLLWLFWPGVAIVVVIFTALFPLTVGGLWLVQRLGKRSANSAWLGVVAFASAYAAVAALLLGGESPVLAGGYFALLAVPTSLVYRRMARALLT